MYHKGHNAALYVLFTLHTLEKEMFHIIDRIRLSIAKRRAANQTFKELNKLSDNELKDIGISRADIRSIAEGLFYRDEPKENGNLKGWV